MTSQATRRKSLVLLRRRDRENALQKLDAALQESEKIAAALDDTESAIAALIGRLDNAQLTGQSSGAKLRMCLDNRRLAQRALAEHEAKARTLKESAVKASRRVDHAQDAVAKAQKALTALERNGDS